MLLSVIFNTVQAHPVHVSLLNIELDESGQMQLVVKLFMDDFEAILNETYACKLKISEGTCFRDLNQYGVQYIQKHLRFTIDNKVVNTALKLQKFTTNHEAIWLYFKMDVPPNIQKSINITNSIMCDKFDDQTNLLIMNALGIQFVRKYNCKETVSNFDIN